MGTHGKSAAPWETYGEEVVGKDNPELDRAVQEYASRRHEGPSSSQSEEELARQRELNYDIAKEYRFVDPRDYQDEKARMGRLMHHDEFMLALRTKFKLKAFLREMSHPQKVALWVQRTEGAPLECAGWMKRGLTTELDVFRFDEHGAPLDVKHKGWRTVLMNLVRLGFLKEHHVRKVYGPATGPYAGLYNSFMQQFRTIP